MPDYLPQLAERRSSVRYLCNRVCFARPNGTSLGMTWGVTLFDVSSSGISLLFRRRLPPGTVLTIQPVRGCERPPIMACVVRVLPARGGWLHGCQLAEPLTESNLDAWAT